MLIWYFWVIFSGLQWVLMMFAVFDVFVSYSSALHTSLARIRDFPLMVTTHNSTALKVNGMTEDIFICSSFLVKKFLYPIIRHKKLYSSSSSRMAGTHMSYSPSRVKCINLRWLYFCSPCPSSSNRLNAWILFGLSISTITSWSGKYRSSNFSLTYLLRRCILAT